MVKQIQLFETAKTCAADKGFKEFEVFPTLWDEQNPCQIYVMALK